MKTKLFFFLCLLATSSVFAQSKTKTKHKKMVKSEKVVEKVAEQIIEQADFEIIKKEFVFRILGQEMAASPNKKRASPFSKTYIIQLKTLVPDIQIDSVYYNGKTETTKYKNTLPINENLSFSLRLEAQDNDNRLVLDGMRTNSVSLRYKKGVLTKFLTVTNFTTKQERMP